MHGLHNKGEVSRRKESAKKDGVWGTHQPAPALENEYPALGILTTHKPKKEVGGWGLSGGGGGGEAWETMYGCLGKTNRLLPTKQKVPVGK